MELSYMWYILRFFSFIGIALLLLKLVFRQLLGSKNSNPFKTVEEIPSRPFETDRKVRKKTLKKSFRPDLVPKNIDAIIIGSGIGGLSCAALLSRSGKKVVVLEQHGRVGGCTHTYTSKGCEFDIGIHYVGNMENGSMNRCLIDLITDSQLQWVQIDDNFDTVVIDKPGFPIQNFPFNKGIKEYKRQLLQYFPKEHKAIDKYFDLLNICKSSSTLFVVFKILPKSLLKLFIKLQLHKIFFSNYMYITCNSFKAVLDELTNNDDLKTMLSYSFGDYGAVPEESCFFMHGMLSNHLYRTGGFYPLGGASEIAYQIIPGIERNGGVVLTQAMVREILIENGRACGVRLTTPNSLEHVIRAPIVISAAGIYNTYKAMIPKDICNKFGVWDNLSSHQPGMSCMQIMVGLKGTKEELGIDAKNYWMFTSNSPGKDTSEYLSLSREDAVNSSFPLLFVSFPSAKDPTWNDRFPNKSTCIIVTLSSISWFDEWKNDKVKKRGAAYDSLKTSFINQAWSQVVNRFPHLKDKVENIEGGSPLSHVHYLNSMHGEIYGLNHNKERFCIDQAIDMRPETPIPNLFLTGQDIFTCGFMGGAFGGLLTASKVLDRYLIIDWINKVQEIRKKKKTV